MIHDDLLVYFENFLADFKDFIDYKFTNLCKTVSHRLHIYIFKPKYI